MDFNREWKQFALDAEVEHYGTGRIAKAHNDLLAEVLRLRELRSSVGVIRWERRVPTEEEMRNRHYLTRHLVVGVTMCEPGERTEASTCWTEVCILPDILPAMDEPPKTVTEWLWVRLSESENVIDHRWLEWATQPKGIDWFRTERTRERVVE